MPNILKQDNFGRNHGKPRYVSGGRGGLPWFLT